MAVFDSDLEEGGTVHSLRGPSGTKRWKNCTGSINLIEKLGKQARKSGLAAAEGTAAHALLQTCLTGGEDAWEHTSEQILVESDGITHRFTITQEMVDGVQMAVDWVREKLAKFPGAILLVEQRVRSIESKDGFGTADIIIVVPEDRLIVSDFKFGVNIPVEADDEQLLSYGHYSFDTFKTWADLANAGAKFDLRERGPDQEVFPDPNTICELYVVQPRLPGHDKGPIRRHVTTRRELARWFYGEILPAIADTHKPDAPLKVGSWCGFCPASDQCPLMQREQREYKLDIEPVKLTDEELNDLCVKGEALIKQHERNREELFKRTMNNPAVHYKDWKLVRKIGHRVFKEGAEKALVEVLGEAVYAPKELRTPAQVEAVKHPQAKKMVQRWAMKPDTGLTIAPRTDRREEQTSTMGAFDKAMGNEAEGKTA